MTFGSLVKFRFCIVYEMVLVLLIAQHRDKTDIEKYVLCESVVRRKACEHRCSNVCTSREALSGVFMNMTRYESKTWHALI